MQTKVHIVEYCDEAGNSLQPAIVKIITADKLTRDIETMKLPHKGNKPGFFGTIKIQHYDDWGNPYTTTQLVRIRDTFIVITKGHFILNDSDTSPLNAYNMSSGGFGVNHLAYSYLVNVVSWGTHKLWESDLIYTESGMKMTQFDMYSYHQNEPKQHYIEGRLDWEVWQSLDLVKIFSKYLPQDEVRDNTLTRLGI
jgi:hypothetical protein